MSGNSDDANTRTTLVFSRRLQRDLHFVVKRYVPPAHGSAPDGATLVCFHGSGSRTCPTLFPRFPVSSCPLTSCPDRPLTDKEVWEPVLERIFAAAATNTRLRIREAWTFDMQSHGASARLNSHVLDWLEAGLRSCPLTLRSPSAAERRFHHSRRRIHPRVQALLGHRCAPRAQARRHRAFAGRHRRVSTSFARRHAPFLLNFALPPQNPVCGRRRDARGAVRARHRDRARARELRVLRGEPGRHHEGHRARDAQAA